MNTLVSAQPHLLLESTELLYAYVNNIPPQELAQKGEYCLSEEAVQEMMDVACAGVSRDDPAVQYYFGRRVIFDDPEQTTCIARILLYNIETISEGPISEDLQFLRAFWKRLTRHGIRMTAINRYTLSFSDRDEEAFIPLSPEVCKLGMSEEFQQMLTEQIAGFDTALDHLERMMTPVSEKLLPLFTPWIQRAEPLAQAWRDYFLAEDAEVKFLKRVRYNMDTRLTDLHVQLRYLNSGDSPGVVWPTGPRLYMHTAVAHPVVKQTTGDFSTKELQCLRLMGSESRMQMLHVLLEKPMSSRELASALDLHLGVVTRDVSNLYEAGLLTQEITDRRRRYRTNTDTLHTLVQHLNELDEYAMALKKHL